MRRTYVSRYMCCSSPAGPATSWLACTTYRNRWTCGAHRTITTSAKSRCDDVSGDADGDTDDGTETADALPGCRSRTCSRGICIASGVLRSLPWSSPCTPAADVACHDDALATRARLSNGSQTSGRLTALQRLPYGHFVLPLRMRRGHRLAAPSPFGTLRGVSRPQALARNVCSSDRKPMDSAILLGSCLRRASGFPTSGLGITNNMDGEGDASSSQLGHPAKKRRTGVSHDAPLKE